MKSFKSIREAEWKKETPWRKVKPGDKKDKYGNTVKDKNVARNLARSAMKKTASGKTESSDAYGKSQDAIANKKKKDAITPQDRVTLARLDALMKMQKRKKESVEEGKASVSKHKRILAIIGKAQNMDQAISMVMKARNTDEKKAKKLVHNAVRSAFYDDHREALNPRQKQKAQKSASQNKSFNTVRDRLK